MPPNCSSIARCIKRISARVGYRIRRSACTAPGSSARCAQRRRGSQRREDHGDPRASHEPARLVRYRGDRLPPAGGRPEQRSVQALTVRLRSKVSVVPDVRTRLRSTTSASPGSARRHLAPRRVMRRHHRAAIRFLRTWLKKQGGLPRRLITDQRRSSPAAHRTVTPSVLHRTQP